MTEQFHGNEIAIIGLAGRFPGAQDIQAFWQNLADGVCSISFFTDEELLQAGISPESLHDPSYVKAGSVIEGIDLFDAQFFGFSPREANIIDPQQRLFLEAAWIALEDAGYEAETFSGLIGVYGGVSRNTYLLNNLLTNPDITEAIDGFQLLIASDKDHLATRISYKLNLRGPSFTVQTACSTSLVAIHLACQSLLSGECDLALAGGVSIKVPQPAGYYYQEGYIFSPDGLCRAFDAQAQGTIDTSGLGVIALKRLSDALEDRDHVYAVIKGSAMNNDGSTKIGYTAPSVQGQVAVISEALSLAGVEPEELSYIEAHGTGTPLGDPIEVSALKQVFESATDKKGFCAIGSVKTNIGHVDAAAGVAGLIKTVLSLQNDYLPASLHFQQPNPAIDFAHSPFYVNAVPQAWKRGEKPRRAGVSSFGIGGTNVHVVLEEAPEKPALESEPREQHLFVLSARTPTALKSMSQRLADYLTSNSGVYLEDVAATLQQGRKAFDYRQILVGQHLRQVISDLRDPDAPTVFRSQSEPGKPALVFSFPGQGAQYIGMGKEIYQQEAVFRNEVDQCCEILHPLLGLDLRQVLGYQTGSSREISDINQTWLAQPALFVVEYALARLWMSWGVQPAALIGHSIGEYVAACLAGVFSVKDALTLVAARGHCIQQAPTGSMLAVRLPADDLELTGDLTLAAINGPAQCVISGPAGQISSCEYRLKSRGVECRQLHTSHAFHSALLDTVLPAFASEVQRIKLAPLQIPYLSNVSGTWITDEQVTDPQYWVQHMRQPVLFGPALEQLKARSEWVLLEVGPGKTLSTFARQALPEYLALSSLPGAQERSSAITFLLTTLGRLWLAGSTVAWSHLYTQKRQRLALPTYPFERERFWIEPFKPVADSTDLAGRKKINQKEALQDWFYLPAWKQTVAQRPPAVASLLTWLVFVDDAGLFAQWNVLLGEREDKVVYVQKGEAFAHIKEDTYTVRPHLVEDYRALLQALSDLEIQPVKILHGWLVRPLDEAQSVAARLDEAMQCGYYSLLSLVQAFERQKGQLQIHVLTNNMQAIAGEVILCPEKSPILGLCKVIPQEYTFIRCQHIDIVLPPEGSSQHAKLRSLLLNEVLVAPADVVVAYRQNQRWVQVFEQMKVAEEAEQGLMLRARGVYMLVGGLGNIGLLYAEYLAQTVQADLVLLGRSPFPAQENWDEWLKLHDVEDMVSRKILRLQALQHYGSRVVLVQADVTSEEQMEQAVQMAYKQFGNVHGVIYAAGPARTALSTPLNELDQTTTEVHFLPKVRGVLVLEKIFQGKILDFCLFQSSLSSILGGLGFGAYAAANLLLDGIVQEHNRTQTVPWLAVNWDGWNFSQQEVAQDTVSSNIQAHHIRPEAGLQAFQYLFSGTTNQIIVSVSALKAKLEQWMNPGQAPEPQRRSNAQKAAHARPQAQNTYVAPRDELEQRVAAIWEEFLGIQQVGIHDNFFVLGGDSLLAIQFTSFLYYELDVTIQVQELLDTPTVAGVAERIRRESEEEE